MPAKDKNKRYMRHSALCPYYKTTESMAIRCEGVKMSLFDNNLFKGNPFAQYMNDISEKNLLGRIGRCPRCGYIPAIGIETIRDRNRFYIICNNCGLRTKRSYFTINKAERKWCRKAERWERG